MAEPGWTRTIRICPFCLMSSTELALPNSRALRRTHAQLRELSPDQLNQSHDRQREPAEGDDVVDDEASGLGTDPPRRD